MNYLLDTHTLLWSLSANLQLSSKVRDLLDKGEITKTVSVISFWEIAIKVSTKRLVIDFALSQLPALVVKNGCSILPINTNHALAVATLPFHHKDPFDRLLIAQAQIESLTLLTKDSNILLYKVPTLW